MSRNQLDQLRIQSMETGKRIHQANTERKFRQEEYQTEKSLTEEEALAKIKESENF
jgi:hypothetical protein